MPKKNRMPAAPWLFWRLVIALVKICFPGPGASEFRLLRSGWVAECPISPRIETSARSAGKIASTP
jgi:hypothetical protein